MKSAVPLSAIAGVLIAGCQLFEIEKSPASPYFLPPKGTQVRINEDIQVPAGWARVFIQRGEVVSYGTLDLYYPSCNLEVWDVKQEPQLIRPGLFTIMRIRRRDEEVVQRKPAIHASLTVIADVRGSDVAMVTRAVRMWLHSDEQRNVFRLTCRGALDDPPDARFISINEMQTALGDKVTLVIGEEG